MLICDVCEGKSKVEKVHIGIFQNNNIWTVDHIFKGDICKECLTKITVKIKNFVESN